MIIFYYKVRWNDMASYSLNSEYNKINKFNDIKYSISEAKNFVGFAKNQLDNGNNKGNAEPAINKLKELHSEISKAETLVEDLIRGLKKSAEKLNDDIAKNQI